MIIVGTSATLITERFYPNGTRPALTGSRRVPIKRPFSIMIMISKQAKLEGTALTVAKFSGQTPGNGVQWSLVGGYYLGPRPKDPSAPRRRQRLGLRLKLHTLSDSEPPLVIMRQHTTPVIFCPELRAPPPVQAGGGSLPAVQFA